MKGCKLTVCHLPLNIIHRMRTTFNDTNDDHTVDGAKSSEVVLEKHASCTDSKVDELHSYRKLHSGEGMHSKSGFPIMVWSGNKFGPLQDEHGFNLVLSPSQRCKYQKKIEQGH